MSHFATVETQIRDVEALRGACRELGVELLENVTARGYRAFAEGREPGMLDITLAIGAVVPLSRLMGEQIAGLRKWAQGRCRMATTQAEERKGRKIAA